MSYYHKYQFTSPEPIFATIKEELRSYFDSGAVDDTMFPIWLKTCLEKIGKASYDINQALICVDNHKARLPDDFFAMREAWMCADFSTDYRLPNSTYAQVKTTSIRLDDPDIYCNSCAECAAPDIIEAVYKTTQTVAFTVQKQFLLSPGNISNPSDLYCANYGSSSASSYDIRDNKFVTNFREGSVYIQYYSLSDDEFGSSMIPDDHYIKHYIDRYIRERIFYQLYQSTTDESFNQSRMKWKDAEKDRDEALILCNLETSKKTVHEKFRAMRRTLNRNRRFDIS